MGNCLISVHATGTHHNAQNPNDLDKLASKFVADLKAKGHNVTAASITYGAEQDLNVAQENESAPPNAAQ